MTRVLLVDDHTIVREGLKRILAEAPDIEVSGEATDARQALDLLRTEHFDVGIVDLGLPDRSGLEVVSEGKGLDSRTAFLVLTAYPEEQYGIYAFKAGASGYLTKKSAPDELVSAVRKVASGGKYVSNGLAVKILSALEGKKGEPHELLSVREYDIMCNIAQGKTVSEIADSICLSVKTVSTYRSRILKKMNLRNNAEIMRYAMKRGLVDS